ncbi:histidine phosphatase family protein [Dictyobacter alpinus]|uniref:histidine phosphatase family protein n=1 Tax=Dictyobacter alpinus TaxID=2014873 RepID=UPI00353160BD
MDDSLVFYPPWGSNERESWAQFMLRVRTALDRIVREHEGKTIVLVCHGGVIDGSFLHFIHMDEWELPPTRSSTRNTAITHWKKGSEGNTGEHWQLVKHNDGFHLQDIGTSTHIPRKQLLAQPTSDGDRPSVRVPTRSNEKEQYRADAAPFIQQEVRSYDSIYRCSLPPRGNRSPG